ncbi:MAG: glycoside hydrolase family 5 protein [Patescibacteria group bacterium]
MRSVLLKKDYKKRGKALGITLLLAITALLVFPKTSAAQSASYLHTEGNRIVNSDNQTVSINALNWFGLETSTFAPHGLWSRNYKDMMNQIKNLGYNTIRLPFSNQALDPSSKANGIDFSKNNELRDLSGIEVMDKIVEYANQIGLKIILDRHRPDAYAQSALWYTQAYPESKWISDWQMLARRYDKNPAVVAADLHNEPHENACWGCGNPSTDWKQAAERAGNAILAVNPNWLIIVEGVQNYNNDYYWWGGNLMGAKDHPVNLNIKNRLVYSTHDYPSSVSYQSWFSASNYPHNLSSVWDTHWGYIHKNNIAPILVGEFGSKLETYTDRQWFDTLINYLKINNISWSFWSFNPNSGDTGGLLYDDWINVNQDKQQKLASIQNNGINIPITPLPSLPQPTISPTVQPTSPTPTRIPSPTPTQQAISSSISVWWPTPYARISGTQPFKALVENMNLSGYAMYWQVDGGQLNPMYDSYTDYPHKETNVDVSGWYWRGNGPYMINFIAKDRVGNIIAQKSTLLYISR